MIISKMTAQKLWKERYGESTIVKDFNGSYMYYDAYGKRNYSRQIDGKDVLCGWNIHHINPQSKGGKNSKGNLACTNIITNDAAGNKSTYWIDGKKYQVRKTGKNSYQVCKL